MPPSKQDKPLVVDLFAGAGGFSLGFEMAGFEIATALEIDAWACDTLRHNHSKTKVIQGDITLVSSKEEIERLCPSKPDVIIGGPPCQGFSVAGPKKDPSDPRNNLFSYFAKWVGHLQPHLFVMENVKGLLNRKNANGDSVPEIIKQTFRDLGYSVQLWTLNAAQYGVPQVRERIFFVGNKYGMCLEEPLHSHLLNTAEVGDLWGGQPAVTLWDAISDLPPLEAGEGKELQSYTNAIANEYQRWARNGSGELFNHVAMSHSKRIVERFKQIRCGESSADVPEEFGARVRNGNGALSGTSYDQNNRRLYPDKPSHTIAASFYANFVHPFQHRNLTAREGGRLQSFPDTYRFLGKKTVVSHRLLQREERLDEKFLCQYNQIGNAVPPLLARAVGTRINEFLRHAKHRIKASSRMQSNAERTEQGQVSGCGQPPIFA